MIHLNSSPCQPSRDETDAGNGDPGDGAIYGCLDHSPAGLLFAVGPLLAPRALNWVVTAVDFAPNFCALLGVCFQGFDGRKTGELC